MRNKIVSAAFRHNKGPSGGPGGVNSLLEIANTHHKMFHNFKVIFRPFVVPFFRRYRLFRSVANKIEFLIYQGKIKWHGKNNPLFIAHDIDTAYLLAKRQLRYILVYHQQGSLAAERASFGASLTPSQKKCLDAKEKVAMAKAKEVIFPSCGAKEAYVTTCDNVVPEIIENKCVIIYNSCASLVPNGNLHIETDIAGKIVFLTVASLSEFKGADQIPKFLSDIEWFREQGIWVLCGSGHLLEKIRALVDLYDLHDNFVHIEERLPQSQLADLYNNATYYLMMHRFSIFDLATLEAMSFGCIPLLSPVGGNLEVDKLGNVIYTKNLRRISSDPSEISELQSKNRKVYQEYFSNEVFIRSYHDICEEVIGSDV